MSCMRKLIESHFAEQTGELGDLWIPFFEFTPAPIAGCNAFLHDGRLKGWPYEDASANARDAHHACYSGALTRLVRRCSEFAGTLKPVSDRQDSDRRIDRSPRWRGFCSTNRTGGELCAEHRSG